MTWPRTHGKETVEQRFQLRPSGPQCLGSHQPTRQNKTHKTETCTCQLWLSRPPGSFGQCSTTSNLQWQREGQGENARPWERKKNIFKFLPLPVYLSLPS